MPSAQGGSLLLPVHLMSVQGPHRHCRTLRGSISWGHQNAERCHFLMEQCQLGAHDRICTTPYLISPGNTQATFGKPRECWEPRDFRLPLSVPGRLWAWRRKSAARMEGEAPSQDTCRPNKTQAHAGGGGGRETPAGAPAGGG